MNFGHITKLQQCDFCPKLCLRVHGFLAKILPPCLLKSSPCVGPSLTSHNAAPNPWADVQSRRMPFLQMSNWTTCTNVYPDKNNKTNVTWAYANVPTIRQLHSLDHFSLVHHMTAVTPSSGSFFFSHIDVHLSFLYMIVELSILYVV